MKPCAIGYIFNIFILALSVVSGMLPANIDMGWIKSTSIVAKAEDEGSAEEYTVRFVDEIGTELYAETLESGSVLTSEPTT